MSLPTFWRRAAFTVAETADLIGATEVSLRAWLARNVCNDFTGRKEGSRVYLSGVDAFYFLLVSQLAAFGVPIRAAMFTAGQIATDADDGPPFRKFLLVRVAGQTANFEHTDEPSFEGPTLVLPLAKLMTDLIDRCAIVYAAEEGTPALKLGTVNGRSIAAASAMVDAELAKMPVNR